MLYIAGMFLFLIISFAVVDYLEYREKKRDAQARDYRRAMIWAPKMKK